MRKDHGTTEQGKASGSFRGLSSFHTGKFGDCASHNNKFGNCAYCTGLGVLYWIRGFVTRIVN